METLAQTEELDHAIAEASGRIELRMEDTGAQTTDAAKEVGFVSAVWEASKEGRDQLLELTWKNAKGLVAAGLAVVPFLGTLTNVGKAVEAGKGVRAAQQFAKAGVGAAESIGDAERILRIPKAAKKAFFDALREIPKNPLHKIQQPTKAVGEIVSSAYNLKEKTDALKAMEATVSKAEYLAAHKGEVNVAKEALKASAKKGALSVGFRGAEWAIHTFDPYADVPGPIVNIFSVVGLVLPGAEIVPAAWQLIHNLKEWPKTVGKMGLAVGEVVANRLNRDYVQVKAPKVVQAAGVFV